MHFTVFHSTATDTLLWEAADGRGNFLITASSKDKTFCHLLYSLQKQKPPVKIIKNIKTCCQNIKTIKTCCHLLYSLQNKNHLSKSSKPAVKTCCQNIKTIKTTCQNHQNLLSKHQNHQNHLSKSSKPAVKTCCQNIKTIKTTCQNHQNLLSITSKPSKPPVKIIKTYCQ